MGFERASRRLQLSSRRPRRTSWRTGTSPSRLTPGRSGIARSSTCSTRGRATSTWSSRRSRP